VVLGQKGLNFDDLRNNGPARFVDSKLAKTPTKSGSKQCGILAHTYQSFCATHWQTRLLCQQKSQLVEFSRIAVKLLGFFPDALTVVHFEKVWGLSMIDAFELLRTKENELARVRKEIESLRIVAALLSETDDTEALRVEPSRGQAVRCDGREGNGNTYHEESYPDSIRLLVQSSTPRRGRFRDWLGRVVGE